jgi:tetratricopeptide (TPR) repeat protein
MKKTFFRTIALSAALLVGAGNVSAQKGYEVPPLDEKLAELANEVVELQISDPDKANKSFVKLLRKIRNDKEELLSVGQFFLDKNNYAGANQCAKRVYELAPDYIPGLMFSGEVCMLRKDYGGAGQRFDEVLLLDSTNIPALKRNAFVYKNVNPHVAVEMLQRIKRLEPDNFEADKELGDIAYNMSEYKNAVQAYSSYYEKEDKNKLDIRSCENYLMSLYSIQDIKKVASVVADLEPLAPKNLMIRRMKFFSSVDNARASINFEADMAKAEENMKYIADKEYNDSLYLYLDYAYAAELKKELGDVPAAIGYYEQALKVDSTKLQGYTELAKLYRRDKRFDDAISTYGKFVKLAGDKVKLSDLLGYGQMYMYASQQDSLPMDQKMKYIEGGDAVFQQVLKEEPTAYQAMLFRARINIIDGSNPEDKPTELYKEALKMMEGRENTEAARFEACRYLAFRGIKLDLLDEARQYTNIMLELNPDNGQTKTFDSYLKSVGK